MRLIWGCGSGLKQHILSLCLGAFVAENKKVFLSNENFYQVCNKKRERKAEERSNKNIFRFLSSRMVFYFSESENRFSCY